MKAWIPIILHLIIQYSLEAQNLPDIIRQRSKAVVSAAALSYSGEVLEQCNGFFINPDGILLIPSSLFNNSDSITITLSSGRKLGVERVVSLHRYFNLAMVKVKGGRDYEYLSPARQTIREPEEVMVLVHESSGDLSDVGKISNVEALPRMPRMGRLNTHLTSVSAGAPVLNSQGALVGVFFEEHKSGSDCALSTLVIQDQDWSPVSLSPKLMRQRGTWRDMTRNDFLMGITAYCWNDFGEASKRISFFLKYRNDDLLAFGVRAQMRLLYGNTEGFALDIASMQHLKPNDGLSYYLKGRHLEQQGKYAEALTCYAECYQRSSSLAIGALSLGKMLLKQHNDVKQAYNLFALAILNDSLLAQAYYERGKLMLQHSSDRNKALTDFQQCIYLDPTQEGVFTIRGTFYFEQRNYSAAIRDFDEAIRRNPSDAHALFNRGIVHFNVGLKDRACKDWEKASRLGNDQAYKYISRYCSDVLNTIR